MVRFEESTITFPYKRSLGPVVGAFMTALTEKRILGIRNGDARAGAADGVGSGDRRRAGPRAGRGRPGRHRRVVDVGARTRRSSTRSTGRSRSPSSASTGPSTPLLHAVDAGSPGAMADGMRVAPRWKGTRIGHIDDIACFVPGEEPEIEGEDTGPAAEPVEMMDYLASITYRNPVPPGEPIARSRRRGSTACSGSAARRAAGLRRRPRLLPDRRARARRRSTRSTCRRPGTITNFAIVTPVQYPGQTETEPFVRVFVLLDGTDVILGYQPVIELPVDDVRVGHRVERGVGVAGRGHRRGRRHGRRLREPARLDPERRARHRRPRPREPDLLMADLDRHRRGRLGPDPDGPPHRTSPRPSC